VINEYNFKIFAVKRAKLSVNIVTMKTLFTKVKTIVSALGNKTITIKFYVLGVVVLAALILGKVL